MKGFPKKLYVTRRWVSGDTIGESEAEYNAYTSIEEIPESEDNSAVCSYELDGRGTLKVVKKWRRRKK